MNIQQPRLQKPGVKINSSKCGSFDLIPECLHLFENHLTSFLLLDKNGGIIDLSEKLCSKLGNKRENLITKNIESYLPLATDKKEFPNFLNQILLTSNVQQINCSFGQNKKSAASVSVQGKCFRTPSQRHTLILCLITNYAQGNENNSLQNSNGLLGVVSHELRTPLAVVLSATWLAEKFALDGNPLKMQQYLNQVRTSVRYLTFILDEYLSADALDKGNMGLNYELFSLPGFCEEIKEQMNTLAKQGQIICYTNTGKEMIVQDKNALHHILLNLLSNALKYSPKNSQVELRSTVGTKTASISVTDHGIGIPEEDKSNIFSRFHRSINAADYEGTGLGLNISKKYAELIKGKISYTSELNKGSVFTITFPIRHRL